MTQAALDLFEEHAKLENALVLARVRKDSVLESEILKKMEDIYNLAKNQNLLEVLSRIEHRMIRRGITA